MIKFDQKWVCSSAEVKLKLLIELNWIFSEKAYFLEIKHLFFGLRHTVINHPIVLGPVFSLKLLIWRHLSLYRDNCELY